MALRFTQRDFIGLRDEMISFMSEKLGDKWDDYSESDETMTLIELLAHCVSNLHFAYDNQKRETDIVTASFPRNLYAHAIRNGYKPSLYKAGKTWITIDLRKKVDGEVTSEFTSLPNSIIIPKYTEIQNKDGDVCVTNKEFVIPANTSHYSIEVYSGEYAFEQFTKADINSFNYRVLSRLNVAKDTSRLYYNDEVWDEVVDVFTDARTNKIYSIEPNFVRDGVRTIIRFFSNWLNDITDTSSITLEYIQTSGANGNYQSNVFTSFLDLNDLTENEVSFKDDIYDSQNTNISTYTDVEICFTQGSAFKGGQNFDSPDVIKKSFIQSIRQTTSLIVLEDYEAFASIKGLTDFYVTDWNKNPDDYITIEYPKDIKALKADPDNQGHNIFSPLNTNITPYWPPSVSYINTIDKVFDTRLINGEEIVFFKSFDVSLSSFEQYKDEHWYQEWVSDSKTNRGLNSSTELTRTIYIASPNSYKESNLNYDRCMRFCDIHSKLREILNDENILESVKIYDTTYPVKTLPAYENPTDTSNCLSVLLKVSNTTNPETGKSDLMFCKYNDLTRFIKINQSDYNETFLKRLFNSYYRKNEIDAILFDKQPVFVDKSEIYSCNIADICFKHDIYTNRFVSDLLDIGIDLEQLSEKSAGYRDAILNKIDTISITLEDSSETIQVPKDIFFDTFVVIDGETLCETEDELNSETKQYEYRHSLFGSPDKVYSAIIVDENGKTNETGLPSYHGINGYIIDETYKTNDSENNLNLPDIYLTDRLIQNSAEDKNSISKEKLITKIGICFRRKNLDLIQNIGCPSEETIVNFGIQEENYINSLYNISYSYSESHQPVNCGMKYLIEKSSENTTKIYIPKFHYGKVDKGFLPKKATIAYENVLKKTSPYLLRLLMPNIYIDCEDVDDDSYYEYDESKLCYLAIENNLVVAEDKLYHDDLIYDNEQLSAKPLNISYYTELFEQNESKLLNDNSELLYIEEVFPYKWIPYDEETLVNDDVIRYVGYTDPNNYSNPDADLGIHGCLRSALTLTGTSYLDYNSHQTIIGFTNNGEKGQPAETNIFNIKKHIHNSILLDVQIHYPKFLKWLILYIYGIEASYTEEHRTLNEKLLSIGVDKIIYALSKIKNSKFTINYNFYDENIDLGKQYSFTANENKRFLACGGTTSWSEELSPSKNYFRWNLVYPEIIEFYRSVQEKQGRGDSIIINPYTRYGVNIHAHIFVKSTVSDMSDVFENIWNNLTANYPILTNIDKTIYVSELVSIIQASDTNILKVCTPGEITYDGTYKVSTSDPLSSYSSQDKVDESSISNFYSFLTFSPNEDIKPQINLGNSNILGVLCIRIQKQDISNNIVYHFERSALNIEKTLAFILTQN